MGSSSKPSGSQTTTTSPWSKQQPYLENAFKNIGQQFVIGGDPAKNTSAKLNINALAPEYYKGSTVVAPDIATKLAQSMQLQRGLQGNEAVNAAQSNLAATSRGDFLNSNPYLDQTFNQASYQDFS